jgi:hypothetical protein
VPIVELTSGRIAEPFDVVERFCCGLAAWLSAEAKVILACGAIRRALRCNADLNFEGK